MTDPKLKFQSQSKGEPGRLPPLFISLLYWRLCLECRQTVRNCRDMSVSFKISLSKPPALNTTQTGDWRERQGKDKTRALDYCCSVSVYCNTRTVYGLDQMSLCMTTSSEKLLYFKKSQPRTPIMVTMSSYTSYQRMWNRKPKYSNIFYQTSAVIIQQC